LEFRRVLFRSGKDWPLSRHCRGREIFLEKGLMTPTRRHFLASTAAPALAFSAGATRATPAKPNVIQEENAKSGTTDWQLTRVMINQGRYRTSLVEGYASRQSVRPGENIDFFVRS